MTFVSAAKVSPPDLDWIALSPLIALTVGACLALLSGLLRSRSARHSIVPLISAATLVVTAALAAWQWDRPPVDVVEAALRMDNLALAMTLIFCISGLATIAMSLRDDATREAGHGEYYALLLVAILGMVVLASAQNLVTVFLGFEVLSIPLYVLCATNLRREQSLESGLKYLIVGSVGSATLLYGLALLYGATGSSDFSGIIEALRSGEVRSDVLLLTSLALILAGLAFKASIAPFHQWTPDVYEGAPTPVTGFMAVATKAAAFSIIIRLFDVAVISTALTWAPALAALALITIVVGNVGAIGQTSVKRILAFSSVAQAGYMLVGVVVASKLGVQAVVFYLAGYTFMNLAAFAVITARERETGMEDHIDSLRGLGATQPLLAWPMTIAMLSLAGFPATVGFFGKFYLIRSAVEAEWGWLAVAIVLGSAVSLVYYLRIVAAMWMRDASEPGTDVVARTPAGRPVMAGGAPEAEHAVDPDPGPAPATKAGDSFRPGQTELIVVAVVFAILTVAFGIFPDPLFDLARDVGAELDLL